MSKRANGEGTIYKRADGRWCASLSIGKGKRKHFLSKSRTDAERWLTAERKKRDDGLPVVVERETLSLFLQRWLQAIKPSIRERTWVRYEQYVRLHVPHEIGKLYLDKLAPQHLQRLYAERIDAGLSRTTVHHLHAMLHRALHQAVRWNLVARNVADLVDPPRPEHHEITTLTPAQASKLLAAAEGDRLEAL